LIVTGVQTCALPIYPRPALDRAHDARRLARQLDAGAGAEAERPHVAVVARGPEAVRHLGRADVARVLDHLREAEPAVPVRVVDAPLADPVATVLAEEHVRRPDHALFDRGGGEDRLEGGAGLVGIGDGAVAHTVVPAVVAAPAGLVRVEGG